jgi:hypothetical protein
VKNIVDDSSCELCRGAAEDSDHIILRCPFALQVWTTLSIDMVSIDASHLWDAPRPSRIPPRHFDSFLLLVSWHLWKHRNSVLFEREAPSHTRFWTACKQDAVSGAAAGRCMNGLLPMPGVCSLCLLPEVSNVKL